MGRKKSQSPGAQLARQQRSAADSAKSFATPASKKGTAGYATAKKARSTERSRLHQEAMRAQRAAARSEREGAGGAGEGHIRVLFQEEPGQSQSPASLGPEERISTNTGTASSSTAPVRDNKTREYATGPSTAAMPDGPEQESEALAQNFDEAQADAPEDDYAAIRTNILSRLGQEPGQNADRPTLLSSSFLRSQGMAGLLQNMDGLRSYPSSLMPGTMVSGLTGQLDGSAMLPGGLIVATPSVISRPMRKRRINRNLRKWSINPITGVAFASAKGVGA